MSHFDFDTTIIGGGSIGSSIAYYLAKNGFTNVAVLDSGRKTVSATARSGGMLRVFHENSEHVELALRNHALLRGLQASQILSEKNRPNGSLYFFDRRRFRDFEKNLKIMETHHYPFEVITSKIGNQRFPLFHWSTDQWAIYEPQAGHLSPPIFCDELLNFSEKCGTSLLENFDVDRICFFRDRYRLFNGDKTVSSKTVILAGGARLLPHLKDLGIGHALKSQPIKLFRSKKPKLDYHAPNFFDRETLQYGGQVHNQHMVISKISSEKYVHDLDVSEFEIVEGQDCYAPNRVGYAGWLPGHPRLLLATGWGGTAFKFSLEIGQRITHVLAQETPERSLIHA